MREFILRAFTDKRCLTSLRKRSDAELIFISNLNFTFPTINPHLQDVEINYKLELLKPFRSQTCLTS